jgi:threonine/homoserine/homoserine lactone efflux protein
VTLEARYRRLTRWFPADWRAEHEDELIGTLLETADPGRETVPVGEAVDLVRSALVVRARRWRRRPKAVSAAGVGLTMAVAVGLVAVVALAKASARDVSMDFLGTSLVVALIPGTGVVYTVSSAIGAGWRRGSVAAVGCTLGIVPHIAAAMLGLSGAMQAGAAAFELVRWVGVAYLLFLGLSMLRSRDALQVEPDPTTPAAGSVGLVIRRGVLVNLLNPKLTVFFFAFLPQFLDTPPRLLDVRLVGLGAMFMLITLVVFTAYAWGSAAVRDRLLNRPTAKRWLQRSLATLLIGSAARLATTNH